MIGTRLRIQVLLLVLSSFCVVSCDNSTSPSFDPKLYPENHVYPEWSANGDSLYYIDVGLVDNGPTYATDPSLAGFKVMSKRGGPARFVTGPSLMLYSLSPVDNAVCIGGGDLRVYAFTNGNLSWSTERVIAFGRILQPRWAPAGDWIAFEMYSDDVRRPDAIWKVRADGTDLTRLSNDDPGLWMQPAWSPDGSRIVYVYYPGNRFGSDLYIMDSTGEHKKQVVTNDYANNNPRFSPDGTKICYERYRGDASQVCVIDSNGSNLRVLADGTTPVWSPDGVYIAYVASSNEFRLNGTIWRMRADGTRNVQLTQSRVH